MLTIDSIKIKKLEKSSFPRQSSWRKTFHLRLSQNLPNLTFLNFKQSSLNLCLLCFSCSFSPSESIHPLCSCDLHPLFFPLFSALMTLSTLESKTNVMELQKGYLPLFLPPLSLPSFLPFPFFTSPLSFIFPFIPLLPLFCIHTSHLLPTSNSPLLPFLPFFSFIVLIMSSPLLFPFLLYDS